MDPKSQSRAHKGPIGLLLLHKGWRRAAYFRYKSWSNQYILCFNSRSSIVALVCLSASIGSQSPLICSKPGGPPYRSQISDRSSSILGVILIMKQLYLAHTGILIQHKWVWVYIYTCIRAAWYVACDSHAIKLRNSRSESQMNCMR